MGTTRAGCCRNAAWLTINRGDPRQCFTPENLALHTATPMFLFQSEYDLANLRDPDMCDPSCESHPPCVNAVGANMTRVVKVRQRPVFSPFFVFLGISAEV